mgnify:CR=1 FL=1
MKTPEEYAKSISTEAKAFYQTWGWNLRVPPDQATDFFSSIERGVIPKNPNRLVDKIRADHAQLIETRSELERFIQHYNYHENRQHLRNMIFRGASLVLFLAIVMCAYYAAGAMGIQMPLSGIGIK